MPEVLVVDDDNATCRAVSLLLRSVGHSADCITNGDEALRVLLAEEAHDDLPRLLVLDVMMRGSNGMEVLRRVKAEPSLNHIAVVMYTAVLDPVSRQRATELGAQAYVVKSGGWAALYPKLAEYLQ